MSADCQFESPELEALPFDELLGDLPNCSPATPSEYDRKLVKAIDGQRRKSEGGTSSESQVRDPSVGGDNVTLCRHLMHYPD